MIPNPDPIGDMMGLTVGRLLEDLRTAAEAEEPPIGHGFYSDKVFLIRPDMSLKDLTRAYFWATTQDGHLLIDLPHRELPADPADVLPGQYGVAINLGYPNEVVGMIVDVGAVDAIGGMTTTAVDRFEL